MRKYKVSPPPDVDMTPMLDIVFIMLIFFIVASSFVKESGVDLDPLRKSKVESTTDAPLIVTINEAGQIDLEGRIIGMPLLSANVEAWMLDKKEPAVVIVASKHASTERLIAATDQIRQAGIFQISLKPKG